MNSCLFTGHVGRDPTIKDVGQSRVANFSLAVTEKWKKDGEPQERTEWLNVVVWSDGLVGIIEKYVHKGDKLLVQGKLQSRKYEKDGVERTIAEIVLQGFDGKIEMLGSPQGGGSSDANDGRSYSSGRTSAPPESRAAEFDDEIPF